MSLHRRAARRDDNEPAIVEALEAMGADVRKMSGKRLPDLLVAWRGRTYLFGVKAPDGPRGGKSKGRDRASGDQRPADWRGGPWEIVTLPEEATAALRRGAADVEQAVCQRPGNLGPGEEEPGRPLAAQAHPSTIRARARGRGVARATAASGSCPSP